MQLNTLSKTQLNTLLKHNWIQGRAHDLLSRHERKNLFMQANAAPTKESLSETLVDFGGATTTFGSTASPRHVSKECLTYLVVNDVVLRNNRHLEMSKLAFRELGATQAR